MPSKTHQAMVDFLETISFEVTESAPGSLTTETINLPIEPTAKVGLAVWGFATFLIPYVRQITQADDLVTAQGYIYYGNASVEDGSETLEQPGILYMTEKMIESPNSARTNEPVSAVFRTNGMPDTIFFPKPQLVLARTLTVAVLGSGMAAATLFSGKMYYELVQLKDADLVQALAFARGM